MKTIKNYIQGNEAGKVVGQLINAIAFICGLAVLVIGITAQLLKHFTGFNLFTDLF